MCSAFLREHDDNGGKGKKGAQVLPLAGIYELSGRPNSSKTADLSRATWDTAACRALVDSQKKHLAVVGNWVCRKSASGNEGGQHRSLALFPEEALLLVEQGLLLLRLAESESVLSVAEVQALALNHAQLCPLYFEVYAHVRELGLAALRLEVLKHLHPAATPDGYHECSALCFRGRPLLALWSSHRASQKGWRKSRPDFIVATSRSCDSLPSASEWVLLEALASQTGSSVKFAVVDDAGGPVFFDCCSGPALLGVRPADARTEVEQPPDDVISNAEFVVEEIAARVKLQGDKVRELKRKNAFATDEALESTLDVEIHELKRLKALISSVDTAQSFELEGSSAVRHENQKRKKLSCGK